MNRKLMKSPTHQVLLLSLACFLSIFCVKADFSPSQTWEPCSPYCNCSTVDNMVIAKCDLSFPEQCESFSLPDDIFFLDLSQNDLDEVPSCVLNKSASISYLSLSGNKINKIEEGSFPELPRLLNLDLSYNRLQQWRGDISTVLPFLESVDFTGNQFFLPDKNLLRLDSLLDIYGIVWSTACGECYLIRTELLKSFNDSESLCILDDKNYSFADEIKYGKSLLFVREGFSPQCLCEREDCDAIEISIPYNMELNTLPRKLFYIEYVFGSTAVALNFVVVLITFGSKSMRKSTSFVLMGNIGLCDILMGIYSILIGRFTVYEFIVNESHYPDTDTFVNKYCTIMGVIFTGAQITSVSTSFLATLERYLSIVHCMNPQARLRKTTALWCLVAIWSAALAFSLLPVFQVDGLRYHGEFTCMMPFINGPELTDTSMTGFAVASLLVLFYLVSFAMYFHIFLHVRKAGISAGVKRKASLAKNILKMVLTNFIFFVIPMVCSLLFVYKYKDLMEAFNVDSLTKLRIYFIMLSWLPVTFLSVNSCLNPFLCAFRHPKFRGEFHAFISRGKCNCFKTSRNELFEAWTLKANKRVDLNCTDAIVREDNFIDRYRSLGTLTSKL